MEYYNEYNSSADLFRIVEDTMLNDMEMMSYVIENSIVSLSLEEAEGYKNKATDKRFNTVITLFENLKETFAKGLAKIKAVCANLKKKMQTFREKRIASYIAKYEKKFNVNKAAATTDKFEINYNKKVLEFTEKDLAKAIDNASKAGKAIANSTVSIARKNFKEINANRHNIFKVSALNKYAENFCCCCGEKKEVTKGNPFSGSFTPEKLLKELKTGSLDVNMSKLIASMEASFSSIQKQADNVIKMAKTNPEKITQEDVAIATASNAIVNGTIKAYSHTLNDVIRTEKAHLSECLKIFSAVANMRVVAEGKIIEYTGTNAALMEAEMLYEDLEFYLESTEEEDE